jgi:hypothetical protein
MNLLEQIIQKALFERRSVAKIRNATAAMTTSARKVGAVHAYAVLIKGATSQSEIESLIEAATLASIGGNETVMSVGRSSKFADGSYKYVCSDELDEKNRQLINVWIVPNAIIEALPNHEPPLTGAEQARSGFSKIGSSIMLTKTQLSLFKNLDGTDFKDLKGGTAGPSDDIDSNDTPKDDKEIVVTKDERTEWLSKNQTKNVTFPYTWYTYNNDKTTLETTVYKATILDNKEYLYTYLKDLNSWFVMKEPEKFIPTIEKQQSDPNFSNIAWNNLWDKLEPNPEDKKKLDVLQGISTLETALTYPYKWNTNNGELTIYTTSPTDEYVYWVQNNVWQTIKKSKFESALKDGSVITGIVITTAAVIASLNKTFSQNVVTTQKPPAVKGKKIGDSVVINPGGILDLYYKRSNGTFINAGTASVGSDASKNKVTIKDISGNYYYVTIGGKSYWITKTSTK